MHDSIAEPVYVCAVNGQTTVTADEAGVTVYDRVWVVTLPAASVAVAVNVCEPTDVPYPVTLQPAGPEVASVAVHVGAAGTDPYGKLSLLLMPPDQVRPGAVASRWIVTVTGPALPPVLVAEHE